MKNLLHILIPVLTTLVVVGGLFTKMTQTKPDEVAATPEISEELLALAQLPLPELELDFENEELVQESTQEPIVEEKAQEPKMSEAEVKRISQMEAKIKSLEDANRESLQLAEEASKEAAALRQELIKKEEDEAPTKREVAMVAPVHVELPAEPIVIPKGVQVGFEAGSSFISANAKTTIEMVVSKLNKEPRLKVQLQGFADRIGNSEYDAIIARARSQVAIDELYALGVNDDRIDTLPFASAQEGEKRLGQVDFVFKSR